MPHLFSIRPATAFDLPQLCKLHQTYKERNPIYQACHRNVQPTSHKPYLSSFINHPDRALIVAVGGAGGKDILGMAIWARVVSKDVERERLIIRGVALEIFLKEQSAGADLVSLRDFELQREAMLRERCEKYAAFWYLVDLCVPTVHDSEALTNKLLRWGLKRATLETETAATVVEPVFAMCTEDLKDTWVKRSFMQCGPAVYPTHTDTVLIPLQYHPVVSSKTDAQSHEVREAVNVDAGSEVDIAL